jgi:hypothetical protein
MTNLITVRPCQPAQDVTEQTSCKGRLKPGLLKTGARGSLRIRAFDRRYPSGTRLEVLIANPAYRSQIKTVVVRANRRPRIATRCQTPGTATRGRC